MRLNILILYIIVLLRMHEYKVICDQSISKG